MAETEFSNKCEILADLWLNCRDEEDWEDFIAYNDLGLPLAYSIANGIIESSAMAENFIQEAWRLMLGAVGAPDGEYYELDEILEASGTAEPVVEEEEEDDEEEDEEEDLDILTVYDIDDVNQSYVDGYKAGAEDEQKRIQDVIKMHKRWAKEKNRANEYMFWSNVGEVLTPIEIDYSEEAYRKSLEDDGF